MAIAVDASTPPLITGGTSGTTATSSAFSPPANSLLAVVWMDYHTQTVASITDNLGSHLTYTKLHSNNFGGDANAEIWIADCPSAQTGMTISATITVGIANDSAIGVIVITGAAAVAGQTGAKQTAGSFSGTFSIAVTTTAANSQVMAVVASRGSGASAVTPSSGMTTTFGSRTYVAGNTVITTGLHWAETTTSPTSVAGTSVTLNVTSPTAVEFSGLAVEILPRPSIPLTPTAAAASAATAIVFVPGAQPLSPAAAAASQATATVLTPNSVIAVTVGADGWYADVQIAGMNVGGTYNLGLGANNDPAAGTPMFTLTAVSLGYDDSGNPTTITRTVYGTHPVRKAYPNAASNQESFSSPNVTVRVALSDYIYAKDNTGAGNSGTAVTANVLAGLYTQAGNVSAAAPGLAVTNNSTRAYPAVVGNWTMPGYDKLGSTFQLRAACFHHSAQQGRPVRAVTFTVTDQHSHTVTQTVNTPSIDGTFGDPVPVVEYIATISTATLTQGDTLTMNFVAYPWAGDSGSIVDSSAGTAQPTPLVGPIFGVCDKTGAYCTSVAVVDPVGGNDATGAVTGTFNSSSPPAAYQHLAAAFNALAAYNNSNYSRNNAGGSVIYVRSTGAAVFTGGTANTTTTPACSLLVTNFPGDVGCQIGTHDTEYHLGPLCKIQGFTINDAGTAILFGGGAFLWLDQCVLNCSGTAPVYDQTVWHVTRCSIISFPNGLAPFSVQNASPGVVRANTGTVTPILSYTVIGNQLTIGSGFGCQDDLSGMTTPYPANAIIAYNRLRGGGGQIAMRMQPGTDTHGMALVQNIIEQLASPDTNATVQIAADTATNGPVNNVLIWHNTIIGGRANLGYNDDGANAPERWGWSMKGNLFDVQCIKADTFDAGGGTQNAVRIGNWPFLYGVGCSGNINGDYTGYSASGSFCWEFLGLKSDQQPTTGNPPGCTTRANSYPQYANRQSYAGSGGAGAGGGDYHIADTSPAASLTYDWVLRYDIAGLRRSPNNASGGYGLPTGRQLGTGLVVSTRGAARPTGLVHVRQLGAPTVIGRDLRPTGQRHTRAQGIPTLSGRTLPAGLVHARGTSHPSINQAALAPAGQTHTRAQGNPTLTIAWIPRPTGQTHTRAQGALTVIGRDLQPAGQRHVRGQGNPTLSGRTLPAGLVHARTQGGPSVNTHTLTPIALDRA